LTAFAKSMGLDEATIQNLMGPASQASTPGTNGLPSTGANGMPNGTLGNSGFNISALLGAALNGGSDKPTMAQTDASAFNQAMTQALSSSTQSPASNANLLQSAIAKRRGCAIEFWNQWLACQWFEPSRDGVDPTHTDDCFATGRVACAKWQYLPSFQHAEHSVSVVFAGWQFAGTRH